MKQVTIDNVRERIAELEMVNSHGELSLRGEFELACLRQLAASLERIAELEENDREQMAELYRRNATIHRLQQQLAQVTGVDDDVRNVVGLLENNEWAEHCTKTELGQRLESEITRLVGNMVPVPVESDADPSFDAMMRALDAFYADDNVPERAMLAAFRILLADVGSQQAPVTEWTKGGEPPAFGKYYVRYMTDTVPRFCIAEWLEYDCCVPNRHMVKMWLADHSRSMNALQGVTHFTRLPEWSEPQEPATDNTSQQFEALAGSQSKPTAAPIIPEGLHPDTADLVIRFATALAEKLHRAEQKYGHANGWMATGWYNECLQQLWDHVEKGDPLDVAAYCAFMWHHGWVTTDYDRGVQQALATSGKSEHLLNAERIAREAKALSEQMNVTESAQRETVAAVKHYTGNEYPTLKFAQNEWCVCGDREDAQELADAINALATSAGSGKL